MTVPLSRIPLTRVAAFSSMPNPTQIWPAVLGLTFPLVIQAVVAIARSVVVRVLVSVPPSALLPPAGIWLMARSELLRGRRSLWKRGLAATAGAMVGALLPAVCLLLPGDFQGFAGFLHLLAPQWQKCDLQAATLTRY